MYLDLTRELRTLGNMRGTLMLIVIGRLETVSKGVEGIVENQKMNQN